MPASRAEILADLDALLEPARFADYCPNGLQVAGAERVMTVATGVSAHLELFERARAAGAELILTHHGILWNADVSRPIDDALKRRLKLLFDADISLAAYHLPLDAHPRLGNNALLARALGAEDLTPFALHRGEAIGCLAQLPSRGISAEELIERVRRTTNRTPLVFDSGPSQIARIALVTGGGCNYLDDAIAAGVDAFITGEPTERVMAQAHESNVHFLAAGHYATETFGVKALGEHLQERFGVRHVFIDVPNPI